MTEKEILKASFVEVIRETLLDSSSFYAQISLKYGDNEKRQFEAISLSSKYYDALEWFNDFLEGYDQAE